LLKKLYTTTNPNKLVDELQQAGFLERESMTFFPKDDGLEIRFKDIKEVNTDTYEQIITPTEIEMSPAVLDEYGNIVEEAVIETQDIITNGDVVDTITTYVKRGKDIVLVDKVRVEIESQALLDEEGIQLKDEETGDFLFEDVEVEVPYQEEKIIEVWNEYDPTQLFSDIQAAVDNHDPLKGILDSQIEIIKEECESKILGGFESDCLGETKVYSSSMNNQATIQGLVLTAIMNMSGFVDEVLEHKAIDEIDCYPWKNEQIIQLGVDLKSHITACKKEAEEKINKLISAK